jgi:hypothetical protein
MGYSTEFTGVLKFTKELTIPQLRKLQSFCGADVRNHPEWIKNPNQSYYYIQYEVTKELDGLQWDGGEKFSYPVETLNLIIDNMRAEWPDFGLEGELVAQGEDTTDRWWLRIKKGKAVQVNMPKLTDLYECPKCECTFSLKDAKKIE